MSFITFSNEAQVHLSLTTDRNKVDEALTELSTLQGSGGTHMSEGLSKAIEQIEEKRSQSSVALDNSIVTVIVVLTDGKVRSLQETLIKVAFELIRGTVVIFLCRLGELESLELFCMQWVLQTMTLIS
jgi:Mg-chelatase subunit ChlD